MHVFFITQWFPTVEQPLNGIFILEHARAVALTHTVSLLYIHGIDATLERSIQVTASVDFPGLTVYRLSYRHPSLPYTTWLRRINGARQAFRLASEKSNRPDIIHANVNNTADVAVILGRLEGLPVVVSEHSTAYERKGLTHAQVRKARFFMNRVEVIMPVCEALGKSIRAYGINRPILSVQNVVDAETFFPASAGEQVTNPQREIALVARLSEAKAVHLAIQAAARLQQQGLYFQLHIAGDGPERAHLESLVVELGLADWVHFYGYLSKAEVAKLLRRASAFLLTSLWENQPVVILEALSCGLPVVASAVGGIPEIITPHYGLLFKPGDLDDLSMKLASLLTNISLYDSQAIRTYAVEHFSPAVVGSRFDAVYQKVIKDRHAFDRTPGI